MFQRVFNQHSHIQMLQRSEGLLRYLATHSLISGEDLAWLWDLLPKLDLQSRHTLLGVLADSAGSMDEALQQRLAAMVLALDQLSEDSLLVISAVSRMRLPSIRVRVVERLLAYLRGDTRKVVASRAC